MKKSDTGKKTSFRKTSANYSRNKRSLIGILRRRPAALLFVIFFAVVGTYLLLASQAAPGGNRGKQSGDFSLVGTHPQAGQQPTTQGKTIMALHAWNGKIYAGYGDVTANTGPIAITPYNPATGMFDATPEIVSGTAGI